MGNTDALLNTIPSGIGTANAKDFDGSDLHLTGNTALATLNPEVRRNNPRWAAAHEYKPFDVRNSLGYKLGQGIHNTMNSPNPVSRLLDKGPLAGGLTGAGIGALTGAAGGYLIGGRNPEGRGDSAKRWAAILALLGGAYGTYSGAWRKPASWRDGSNDARAEVLDAIKTAPGLSYDQRSKYMFEVSRLPDDKAIQLARILGTVTGFGVGAAIAKFLFGAGMVGTVATGIVGGIIGAGLAPSKPKDAFGRPSFGNRDMFGRPILFNYATQTL